MKPSIKLIWYALAIFPDQPQIQILYLIIQLCLPLYDPILSLEENVHCSVVFYFFSRMLPAFFKPHKHQWPRIPPPALFSLSGPLILKLPTKPHVLIHSAEAFWESTANGASGKIPFWVRGRHHLLGHLESLSHQMQEQCWAPRTWEKQSLMFCERAPNQFSLYPDCPQLPHANSPSGFLSKPPVCMGVPWHSAIPSIQSLSLPPEGNSHTSRHALQSRKALCVSLHVNRCWGFDIWTIRSTDGQTSQPHFGLSHTTLQCEFSNSRSSVLL